MYQRFIFNTYYWYVYYFCKAKVYTAVRFSKNEHAGGDTYNKVIVIDLLTHIMPEKFKNFHPVEDCPIRSVLGRLGDKWSLLVVVALHANGTMRFRDLHRAIEDISQRMLTVTLRSLEADGLVGRTVYAEVPPRVEYRLTPMGESLMPHIQGLVGWALEHTGDILDRRRQCE